MQPDRDRLIGLRSSEGGHVAVGGNAHRRGLAQAIGVIRYPMQFAVPSKRTSPPGVSTCRASSTQAVSMANRCCLKEFALRSGLCNTTVTVIGPSQEYYVPGLAGSGQGNSQGRRLPTATARC